MAGNIQGEVSRDIDVGVIVVVVVVDVVPDDVQTGEVTANGAETVYANVN